MHSSVRNPRGTYIELRPFGFGLPSEIMSVSRYRLCALIEATRMAAAIRSSGMTNGSETSSAQDELCGMGTDRSGALAGGGAGASVSARSRQRSTGEDAR